MHEIVEVFPLFASIVALCAGPFVYRAASRTRGLVVVVHVALVAAIIALVVLEILPECVAEAGWPALAVAALGLLGPVLAERGLVRAAVRGGAPAGAVSLVIGVAVVALGLHAFADGVALIAGHEQHGHAGHGHDHDHGLGLFAALILHRLPEGATIYWLLRSRGERAARLGLFAVAAATVAGFMVGDAALPALEGIGLALLQAFVGGVLLHVVLHHKQALKLEAAHA